MAILRTHGFVQLRRGLMEHVFDGLMSPSQVTLYVVILINADPSSGIWCGSAGLLAALCHIPKRTCREGIERLEKAGYLKRFAVVGRSGSYPILVHRFECSDGAMKGMRLNAYETTDYKDAKYESCQPNGELNGQPSGQPDGQPTAAKYLDNKRTDNKRKKPTPPMATLPDWIPPGPWGSFVDMRKRIRAPLSDDAIRLTITHLEKLRTQGNDPGAVLDQSVQYAYRGVFPLKQENSNGTISAGKLSASDQRNRDKARTLKEFVGEDDEEVDGFGSDALPFTKH